MQEIWKEIPGYNGKYLISNLGNILSTNYSGTGKTHQLKQKKHHTGYLFVRLSNGSRKEQKNCTIHSLVAHAFIPNPLNKRCVNHIDGDKTNNCISNLEWTTHKENSEHAIRTGLRNPHKNNHPKGKYTPNSRRIDQYDIDGNLIKSWDCISDAARECNILPSQITNNAKGRNKTVHGFVWKYHD